MPKILGPTAKRIRNRNADRRQKAEACAWCQRRRKLTVDHAIPIAFGGDNAAENIQVICGGCHSLKTEFEQSVQRMVLRGRIERPNAIKLIKEYSPADEIIERWYRQRVHNAGAHFVGILKLSKHPRIWKFSAQIKFSFALFRHWRKKPESAAD